MLHMQTTASHDHSTIVQNHLEFTIKTYLYYISTLNSVSKATQKAVLPANFLDPEEVVKNNTLSICKDTETI